METWIAERQLQLRSGMSEVTDGTVSREATKTPSGRIINPAAEPVGKEDLVPPHPPRGRLGTEPVSQVDGVPVPVVADD
jgi:hypothetical protein